MAPQAQHPVRGTSQTRPEVLSQADRRLVEQGRLDRLRSLDERNRLGQFATPPALARAIAEYAASLRQTQNRHDEPVRFLDPALGTGAFFEALRASFPGFAQATGVELDPAFASVAADLWNDSGLEVIAGDFTKIEPPLPERRANLILANPPYVRHHHLGLEAKRNLAQSLARRAGLKLNGLAGLYAYFLLLADAWLAEGGLALWLVPSEFLDVNYGQGVRDYLLDRVTLCRIHRFRPSDAQFNDALVTSAVVAFKKSPPPPSHRPLLTFGGSLARPEHSEAVPLATLRTSRKWSRFPSQNSDRPAQPAIFSGSDPTLGDLFAIKRGVVTGANAFFILSRQEALARGFPADHLTPILPSPRHLSLEVIEADPDGFPRLPRPLVLVDTDRPEIELRESAPALAAYLAEGRARGLASGYLASRRTPWYAQEHRAPPPFLCTYMARGRVGSDSEVSPFRFFWNRSQAIAPNVYLLLYPRGAFREWLEARPDRLATLLALLQAIPAHQLVGEGRVYGGGLYKIEPRELAALPAGAIARGVGLEPSILQNS